MTTTRIAGTAPACRLQRWAAALPLITGLLLLTPGCAVHRQPAVPDKLTDRANLPGMPCVRTWADAVSPEFYEGLRQSAAREAEWLKAQGHTGLPPAHFLAISGGGANGAYGAGLLCGWTAAGTRPEFKLVTGISTGALTAPFAYLGPAYDKPLRDVYTSVRTRDILRQRGLLAGLTSDALADNAPLWKLLDKYVDAELLAAVAREHNRGRVLLVGTTNLDAQRGVIWNMSAIAASGHPRALELFRSIMIASAAIPAAFPPVMIDVEADGKPYQEMHVDGGAMTQVFVYPPSFDLHASGIERERRVYVIRNSRLDPNWADVQRRTLNIAGRAIESLIQTQGIGDLYRIYLIAQRDDVQFNLTFIPPTFREAPAEPFDPVYMTKLFQVGYDAAHHGSPWQNVPPGYVRPHAAGAPGDPVVRTARE